MVELDDAEEPDEERSILERSWSMENWLLIGSFFLLTLVGIAISTGLVAPGIVDVPEDPAPDTVTVPLYVYLYASLGALGYVFTKLMTRLEDFVEWGDLEELVEMGLRIPAAWILAAGVYLLFAPLTPEATPETPRLLAGIVFLVGLYVNVTVKALGELADRLLGQ